MPLTNLHYNTMLLQPFSHYILYFIIHYSIKN
nr:MAG TPA: hypothetical protein [Caudoviricetes sp.]